MSLPPPVMRRLVREITHLQTSPPEGIRIQTSEDNLLDLTGIIAGPEGTPYAGGYFKVRFTFTEEFPTAPPKCRFATKIFHPNVSGAGEICVNTLKKDWKPTYGIEHILVTVKCLLIYPNPESALDEEAGKLLLEDYASYCSRAKLITSVHATPRVRPIEFDTPSASDDTTTAPSPSTSISSPPSPPPPSLSATLTKAATAPLSVGSLAVPAVTRKPSSPVPTVAHAIPLKSSPGSNTGITGKGDNGIGLKDRHCSPSPLSTADSNVGLAVPTVAPTTLPASGNKAVKRAATGATSGAEKRKKALKRL
ncbi:unnamed protein product [Mycena citricolor]|uniref:E2 ubiquitin-conjugating enzyme n=1 Tax=Mycena citricolor TaxID=2018698 RepID=A0AAD2HBS5_9AGAR|nr:unnamed protein product [Mycena citricolor]CAK5271865.1 unnamed protein product [Mycena citricolor]